jgi:hypothetical protein
MDQMPGGRLPFDPAPLSQAVRGFWKELADLIAD